MANSDRPEDAEVLLHSLGVDIGEITPNADELPVPESTSKITFSWIRKKVSGVWVYSIIASPLPSADHSCNKTVRATTLKNNFGDSLNKTVSLFIDYAVNYVINELTDYVPVLSWLPIDVFTDITFTGNDYSNLKSYEASLVTRTVHQFIYVQNSAGQYAYYGSANCVHINIEEIMRKYEGSVLKTSVHNDYRLEVAKDYYDWPAVCTNGNLTGYGITSKRNSFVDTIYYSIGNSAAFRVSVVKAANISHLII